MHSYQINRKYEKNHKNSIKYQCILFTLQIDFTNEQNLYF